MEGGVEDRRSRLDLSRLPLVDEDDRGHENRGFAKSG
jgi:hypothetical protein